MCNLGGHGYGQWKKMNSNKISIYSIQKKEKQLLLYIVYDIPLSESTEKLGFEDDIHIHDCI